MEVQQSSRAGRLVLRTPDGLTIIIPDGWTNLAFFKLADTEQEAKEAVAGLDCWNAVSRAAA